MNGIVVVCGLPGVGKTTFARWLAEDLDAAHLRTDVIRKEMFDEPTYSTAESEAVYDELLERGSELLQDGQAVVLDGTYRKQIQRYEGYCMNAFVKCSFVELFLPHGITLFSVDLCVNFQEHGRS